MAENEVKRFIDSYENEPWKKQLLTDLFLEMNRLRKENNELITENNILRDSLKRFTDLSGIIRDISKI